jgi:hypothetical protein
MINEQFIVGGTSIAIGLLSVAAGASNLDAFYQVTKIKWIETRGGRALARTAYAMVGVTLIALGIAIAMGYAPNSAANSS